MHFCAGLPIILVGCKKDLRVIEEPQKVNQRSVTPEEVSFVICLPLGHQLSWICCIAEKDGVVKGPLTSPVT